jgi:hypothetical protein
MVVTSGTQKSHWDNWARKQQC